MNAPAKINPAHTDGMMTSEDAEAAAEKAIADKVATSAS